jgi:hypothetical protein
MKFKLSPYSFNTCISHDVIRDNFCSGEAKQLFFIECSKKVWSIYFRMITPEQQLLNSILDNISEVLKMQLIGVK